MWLHARLASLLDVRVGEMSEGEAGDAGRWYGKTWVVWGAVPAGLQHAPYWKARRCRRGHSLWYGVFIRLGQEGRCRGGEVIIPLKTTTCRDLMDESGHWMAKEVFNGCKHLVGFGITFFICGAFRVGEPVQVASSGQWVAELWYLTIWAWGVVTQFLGGGLLNQNELDFNKNGHTNVSY